MALMATLGWVEAALSLGARLRAAIAVSDEPGSIYFYPNELPEPPKVDVDAIAAALATP
jgi:hypothetical protein